MRPLLVLVGMTGGVHAFAKTYLYIYTICGSAYLPLVRSWCKHHASAIVGLRVARKDSVIVNGTLSTPFPQELPTKNKISASSRLACTRSHSSTEASNYINVSEMPHFVYESRRISAPMIQSSSTSNPFPSCPTRRVSLLCPPYSSE